MHLYENDVKIVTDDDMVMVLGSIKKVDILSMEYDTEEIEVDIYERIKVDISVKVDEYITTVLMDVLLAEQFDCIQNIIEEI